MTEVHQCKDCGLLAVRHRDTRDLVEVEQIARRNGTFDPPSLNQRYVPGFFCAAGFVDHQLTTGLHESVDGILKPRDEAKRLENCKAELAAERPCTEFVKWRLGFSPKEHIEMSWLAEQREWHRKCDAEDRQWREETHRETLRQAKEMHWREIVIIGVAIGGLTFLSTIAAAFIERNSLFPDPQLKPPVAVPAPAVPSPSQRP